MDAILKKLNYKGQEQVFALNTPESFEGSLASVNAEIKRRVNETDEVAFAIGFAMKQAELNEIARSVGPRLAGDAVFWICYPKSSSKKYKCDFNRDTGWEVLGGFDLEPVRQVAIDEDWSALRFRKVAYIKKMIRKEEMTLSSAGRERVASKKAEGGAGAESDLF